MQDILDIDNKRLSIRMIDRITSKCTLTFVVMELRITHWCNSDASMHELMGEGIDGLSGIQESPKIFKILVVHIGERDIEL